MYRNEKSAVVSSHLITLVTLTLLSHSVTLAQHLPHPEETPGSAASLSNLVADTLAPGRRLCRLHRVVHVIQHQGCRPKRLLSVACRGYCESYTQYSSDLMGLERFCSCCQANGKITRRLRMTCRADATDFQHSASTGGVPAASQQQRRAHVTGYVQRIMQITIPSNCMCRPCSGSGSDVPDILNPLDGTQFPVSTVSANPSGMT